MISGPSEEPRYLVRPRLYAPVVASHSKDALGASLAGLAMQIGAGPGDAPAAQVRAFDALTRAAEAERPELRPAMPPRSPRATSLPRQVLLARVNQLAVTRHAAGLRHALVLAAERVRDSLALVANAEARDVFLGSFEGLRDAVASELPDRVDRLPAPLPSAGHARRRPAVYRAALRQLQRLLIETDHRLAVFPEGIDGGRAWCFVLLHDGAAPVDDVTLVEVGYEGLGGHSTFAHHVALGPLPPGERLRVFVGDDEGAELRTDVTLRVRRGATAVRLRFEFPKLYRRRSFPLVPGLGREGIVGRPLDAV